MLRKLADNSVLGQVLASGVRAVIAEPRITEEALRDVFESSGRAAVHRLGKAEALAPIRGRHIQHHVAILPMPARLLAMAPAHVDLVADRLAIGDCRAARRSVYREQGIAR